jgi:hypothetical protein
MTSTLRTSRLVVLACLATSLTALSCSAMPSSSISRTSPTTSPAAAAPATTDAAKCAQSKAIAAANPPLYASSTTWNQPAACLSTRADSAHWADNWFNYATVPGRTDASKRGAIDIAFDEYSTPIYDAAEATGNTAVFITGWGRRQPGRRPHHPVEPHLDAGRRCRPGADHR